MDKGTDSTHHSTDSASRQGGGDPQTCPAAAAAALAWYPLRATYGRSLQMQELLRARGMETFVPMREETAREGGRLRHRRVPAVSGLLFVRGTRERLTRLKHECAEAAPLRFIMRRAVAAPDAPAQVITVPARQMDHFMRVCQGPADQVTYLAASELAPGRQATPVRITSGPFAGVEGTLRRIRGNRRVVVEIPTIAGVCIEFVPREWRVEEGK